MLYLIPTEILRTVPSESQNVIKIESLFSDKWFSPQAILISAIFLQTKRILISIDILNWRFSFIKTKFTVSSPTGYSAPAKVLRRRISFKIKILQYNKWLMYYRSQLSKSHQKKTNAKNAIHSRGNGSEIYINITCARDVSGMNTSRITSVCFLTKFEKKRKNLR